jgi:hypothetical protein
MGNRPLDRQGFLGRCLEQISRPALAGGLLLLLPVLASGQESTAPPATEEISHQAYRISLHLSADPAARLDEAGRSDLLRNWQILARRFVGAPWVISIAPAASALSNLDLETIAPEAFSSLTSFDKVWVVRIACDQTGSRLVLTGREYDVVTRWLGPPQQREVTAVADLPRALLQFTRDLFNPTAKIIGQEAGKALLTVRGASIAPASPLGQVAGKGTVFLPLRLASLPSGGVRITRIPFTYLQVEENEGPVARCAIVSALADPLTRRVANPNTLAGMGMKPGAVPTRLRFVTKLDRAPAAGYTLTARIVPQGQPREMGATDRAGRIVLEPGFADGLVILRLVAGYVEPLVELPLMPGESALEREIPIETLPDTVALEARFDSLRDEVIDLVALRARLEARMKARADGEDWTGLAESLKEYSELTLRDQLAQRLTKLKDNAATLQAETKKPVLTRTALAQISDLQSMIDRYLDDDVFKAYADALEQSKSKAAVLAKARAAAKRAPAPAPASGGATTIAGQPPKDASPAAGSAQPPASGVTNAPVPQAPAKPQPKPAPSAPTVPF